MLNTIQQNKQQHVYAHTRFIIDHHNDSILTVESILNYLRCDRVVDVIVNDDYTLTIMNPLSHGDDYEIIIDDYTEFVLIYKHHSNNESSTTMCSYAQLKSILYYAVNESID